jgi:hypothetical protein
MTMTSVAGHLTELCFPDHISGNWKIDPVELFSAPVEKKIEVCLVFVARAALAVPKV